MHKETANVGNIKVLETEIKNLRDQVGEMSTNISEIMNKLLNLEAKEDYYADYSLTEYAQGTAIDSDEF